MKLIKEYKKYYPSRPYGFISFLFGTIFLIWSILDPDTIVVILYFVSGLLFYLGLYLFFRSITFETFTFSICDFFFPVKKCSTYKYEDIAFIDHTVDKINFNLRARYPYWSIFLIGFKNGKVRKFFTAYETDTSLIEYLTSRDLLNKFSSKLEVSSNN